MMTRAVPRLAITQSELFRDWPDDDIEKLVKAADMLRLDKGEVLHRPRDVARHLFLLSAGSMQLSFAAAPDDEITIRFYYPGDFHGLGPLISNVPYVYTATARLETHLVRIPGPFLLDMLARNGRLAIAMFAGLNKRHRNAISLYADAATHSMKTRIATLLESLLARGDPRDAPEVVLAQTEIAHMLGSRRQVINRELRAMEAEGILRLEYGRIVIADTGLLKALAATAFGRIGG